VAKLGPQSNVHGDLIEKYSNKNRPLNFAIVRTNAIAASESSPDNPYTESSI